jgi:hypothetical protein
MKQRQERLLETDVHLAPEFTHPSSDPAHFQGSFLQAVAWINGQTVVDWDFTTDRALAVDPTVRMFGGLLGGCSPFALWRDELKPFVASVARTRMPLPPWYRFRERARIGDANAQRTVVRVYRCADFATRQIAAKILSADWAERVAVVGAVVDLPTARRADSVLSDASTSDPAIYAAAAMPSTYHTAGSYGAAATAYSSTVASSYAASQTTAMTRESLTADAIVNAALCTRCALAAAQAFVPGAMMRRRTEQLDHAALAVAYHCVAALASAAATRVDDTEAVKAYWSRGLALLDELCSISSDASACAGRIIEEPLAVAVPFRPAENG